MPKLSALDIFRKVPHDLTQATRRGGLLSLFVASLIGLVLFCEVWTYVEGETKSHIVLDNNSESKLAIHFSLTFFELPCRYATIEVWDYLGNSKLDVTTNVKKTVIGGEHGEEHKYDFEPEGKVHTEIVDPRDHDHLPEEAVQLNSQSYGAFLKEHEYTFVLYYVDVSHLLFTARSCRLNCIPRLIC